MKRFLQRLSFYHWIVILFAVLLLGLFIREKLHPRPIYATKIDAWNLYHQMDTAFSEKVPKDSYSYFRVDYYSDETTRFLIFDRWKVMLEIGVTDEAVIDDFLASWTGEGWDKLMKIPDSCSLAKQEEFIERAKAIDWGPGVGLNGFTDSVGNAPGEVFSHREMSWPQIDVYVKLSSGVWAEAASWEEMPQQLKDLAKEMGVPGEIIYWRSPELSEEPLENPAPLEVDPPEPVPAPEPDHAGDPDWPSSGPDPITGPPDMDPQENPDTSVMYTDEENAARLKELEFYSEIGLSFSQGLPKESYSYYNGHLEGNELVLEIGVMDEAAVDAYLASWTGTKWDRLVKKPGRVSQAKQEKFAEKAEKLEFAPGVSVCGIHAGLGDSESGETKKIEVILYVDLPPEERGPWTDIPQQIKALAKEMGIPEDMLNYGIMPIWDARHSSPGGTITNPDT